VTARRVTSGGQPADADTPSRWRKVRTLGQQAYADALVDALFNARFGHPVTTAHLEAMGYRQVPP